MMLKRIFSAITAAAICLTISSCGKQLTEPETASKDHIFREEKIELPKDLNYISSIFYNDGKIYIVGVKSERSGNDVDTYRWSEETAVQTLGLDGKAENTVIISKEEGNSYNMPRQISKVCGESGGGIAALCITAEFTSTGVTSEYTLVRYSETGEKLSDVNLSELMTELDIGDLYAGDMLSLDDGNYLLMLEKTIAAIDSSGKLLYEIKDSTLPEGTNFYRFAKTVDGRIFTSYSTYEFNKGERVNKDYLIELDIPNQKFGEKHLVSSSNFISGTDKHDLLIVRESGLAGYDIETGETETIIDWLKSGYDTSVMDEETVNVLPDGRIICINYDYDKSASMNYNPNEDVYLSMLTEIPPEELPDRKSVRLYALSIDWDTRMHILEFNKNNPEYEIELTSYADYTDGADRMNMDMISGNVPDVIIMGTQSNNNVPVENYISKGLFADIYKFIDSDPEMERGDFLENVLKAYEVNGNLYQVVPMFTIETIAAKTDLVGETRGWTIDEFIDFVDAHPDSTPFGDFDTKDDVLEMFINSCYESYIDMETGKCSFDSDEFIRLLEFCNRFPAEYSEEAFRKFDYYTDVLMKLRSGERLFSREYINEFSAIRMLEKGDFDAAVTFKGYPTKSGNGSSIQGGKSFAITAKAANPEGAWQFVRYFLTEEYQDDSYSLPVRVSSLEKKAEASKERRYFIDPFGEKQYYDITLFDIIIGENTDEDNEKLLDFIKSVDSVYHDDKYVKVIVEEEAGAYFAGQKSAEEVAEIIQNRVQNYLDENR